MSSDHPYRGFPDHSRWSRAVASPPYPDVDPVVDFPFTIAPTDKVATGGSCFAQHIARHLKQNGLNYYVVEDGHPLGSGDTRSAFNYGTYSARYGNVYTARQLLQLMRRCLGLFDAAEPAWVGATILDPFRPTIQPDGFASLAELAADRAQHLKAVRHMFESLDVFVFTLGLTEYWYAKRDGAAFPICPGVSGGVFDADRYGFANQSVFDVVGDMDAFLDLLKSVNPRARVILTVSPVPLAATAEPRHVLVSTTLSKAVLRTACDELVKRRAEVAYFPSFEIVTGGYNRGRYFADDLRSVTEEGVEHVMRLFLKHVARMEGGVAPPPIQADQGQDFVRHMQRVVAAICDEELLTASDAARG